MSTTVFTDHYDTLEVAPSASAPVIEAAYKAKMKIHHPDRGGDPALAERINTARDILTDPVKRSDFDRERTSRINARTTSNPSGAYASAPGTGFYSAPNYHTATPTEPQYTQPPAQGRNMHETLIKRERTLINVSRYAGALVFCALAFIVLTVVVLVGYLYVLGMGWAQNYTTLYMAGVFLAYGLWTVLAVMALIKTHRTRFTS